MFRQTVMKFLRLSVHETVEFRYDFKLLQLAFRFQTLTVGVTVSHFFMPVSWERNILNVNFAPFSNSAGIV